MKIAIIPARSGSKSLIDKNILLLDGKPLLVHSIECALQSELFDEVFISTDSQQYADIAKQYGGSVPFLRDTTLAGDDSYIWDAVRGDLLKYEAVGKQFETVVLLQPTSPLRVPEDIKTAYQIYEDNKADSVISVCKASYSPLIHNTLPKNNSLKEFLKYETFSKPRQQLSDFYRVNGAIYIVRYCCPERNMDLYGEKSYAYIMPKERSVDIDDRWDFIMAEALYMNLKSRKEGL